MDLIWIENDAIDVDGEKSNVHYLVNPQNQQCLATITVPRLGNLLYVTDIRVSGVDRSWLTLEAAKHHCEMQVELDLFREMDDSIGKSILRESETITANDETKGACGETPASIAGTKRGDNETCPKKSKSRFSNLLNFLHGRSSE